MLGITLQSNVNSVISNHNEFKQVVVIDNDGNRLYNFSIVLISTSDCSNYENKLVEIVASTDSNKENK